MTKVDSGTLPEGWKSCRFGECARLVNGRAYSQDELLDNGTPVLRIQNLKGGDRWYYSDLKLPEEKYCVTGDLLFAWSASFGPYRFSGPKSIFHYHIWRVLPSEVLDKAFAYYLLQWVTESVKLSSHGVAMLHMTKAGMEAWPIRLPPLSVQQRISEVLDRAVALQAKRRAALAKLDSLTKSIFFDLFGDPVTNARGWEVRKLSEISHFENGDRSSNYPSGDDLKNNGVLFLNTKNVVDDRLDLSTSVFITEEKFKSLSRGKARRNDLVITLRGTLGACCIFDCEYESAFINAQMMIIRPTAEGMYLYLYALLTSRQAKDRFEHMGYGAAVRQLSASQLSELPIPVPPPDLQREFASRIVVVEKLKAANRSSLAKLDALFSVLQHRAFRGEL